MREISAISMIVVCVRAHACEVSNKEACDIGEEDSIWNIQTREATLNDEGPTRCRGVPALSQSADETRPVA